MEIHAVNQEVHRHTEEGTVITDRERQIVFRNLTESEYDKLTRIGASILRNTGSFDPQLGEYINLDPFLEERVKSTKLPEHTFKIPEPVPWTDEEEEFLKTLLEAGSSFAVFEYRREFPNTHRSDASIRRKHSRMKKTVKVEPEHEKRQEPMNQNDYQVSPKIKVGNKVKIIDQEINRLFENLMEGIAHEETHPMVLNTHNNVAIIGYPNDAVRIQTSQDKIAPIEG